MILFPGTKINLGLQIVEKRSDGFHNIETIFYPINYSDALEVVSAESFSFTQSGIEIPGEEDDNLVVKAYRLMKERYDFGEVAVHLHKHVPPGTGLGGGSADAAGMIRLIDQLFSLNRPKKELAEVAAALGSDCAFFIYNSPCLATGKGEKLSEIDVCLSGKQIALVLPGIHISTPKAYGQCIPKQPEIGLKTIIQRPMEQWQGLLVNDFESLALIPEVIGHIKQELLNAGAIYAAMSGSGSAVYGIFDERNDLKSLADHQVIWRDL